MVPSQARRLKKLEKENARLKKLVADLSLDKSILEEALEKSHEPSQAAKTGHPRAAEAGCL